MNKHPLTLFALVFGLIASYGAKSDPGSLMLGQGVEIHSHTLQTLQAQFPTVELQVGKNPAYAGNGSEDKVRVYRGFRLKDIVSSLLPAGGSLADYVLKVTCLDGYDPVLEQSILGHLNTMEAVLAFEQVDGPWDLVPAPWGIVNPGPYYLVWSSPQGTYAEGWPFQVKSLQLIKKSDHLQMMARLAPAPEQMGRTPKSLAEEGFRQFRGKCLTCHSINGIGGRKANVDLLPLVRSLGTESAVADFLRVIVRNPPAAMADVKEIQISDQDLIAMSAYLLHMSGR